MVRIIAVSNERVLRTKMNTLTLLMHDVDDDEGPVSLGG